MPQWGVPEGPEFLDLHSSFWSWEGAKGVILTTPCSPRDPTAGEGCWWLFPGRMHPVPRDPGSEHLVVERGG